MIRPKFLRKTSQFQVAQLFTYLLCITILFVLVFGCATQQTKLTEVKDRFIISVDGKFGFIDKAGTVIIEAQFNEVDEFWNDFAKVRIGDKWGYVDKSGKMIIYPQFGQANRFSEGFAPVKIGDKWGYIDTTGKILIYPQFDHNNAFSEGLAEVQVGNKSGFIDKAGKIIINPQFESAGSFSEGLCYVEISDKFGYIDKTGKIAINPQFDDAVSFSEGLAGVKIGDKHGVIDKTGKMIINPQFDGGGSSDYLFFNEGMASVKVVNKVGFINKTGRYAVNPQFDSADGFTGGLARFCSGKKTGYIDMTGKEIWSGVLRQLLPENKISYLGKTFYMCPGLANSLEGCPKACNEFTIAVAKTCREAGKWGNFSFAVLDAYTSKIKDNGRSDTTKWSLYFYSEQIAANPQMASRKYLISVNLAMSHSQEDKEVFQSKI